MSNYMDENDVMRRLMKRLQRIYDNKDFVCGTISIARDVSVWQELLDSIETLEREQEPISSDDILALTIALRRDADRVDLVKASNRRIAAAML